MLDYQIEEMMIMYQTAKQNLNGDCPLLEDEVFVAMVEDIKELQKMHSVNRLEVIDADGRNYVRYLDKSELPKYSLQDDNKTLKIFLDDKTIG
jgi:hypothetical protein